MAFQGVFVSLVLHALFIGWVLSRPVHLAKDSTALEVEIVETDSPKNTPENSTAKTVVLKAQVPLSELTNVGKARFLSEDRLRVKVEQQARFSGLTENRGGGNTSPQKESKNQDPSRTQLSNLKPDFPNQPRLEPSDSQDGMQAARQNRAEPQGFAPRDLSVGVSRVNEALPTQIKFGDFTALNTDQYLFYSFYARIAPLIRFHWERNVERAIDELTARNFSASRRSEWDTAVTVTLDSKGYHLQTVVDQTSQIEMLDRAVVLAFRSSTPFLNPPREMIREDGRIQLKYAFRVYWTPRQVAAPARRM